MNAKSTILDRVINLAILLSFLLISVLAIQKLVYPVRSGQITPKVGSKITLPGVDWSQKPRSLVLALSTGCHYCTDSASFYSKLAPRARSAGTPTLAVFPQDVPSGEEYLASHGVHVSRVIQATLDSIQVDGTPTLILVDQRGVVTKTWVGKLSADREGEVLTEVASSK